MPGNLHYRQTVNGLGTCYIKLDSVELVHNCTKVEKYDSKSLLQNDYCEQYQNLSTVTAGGVEMLKLFMAHLWMCGKFSPAGKPSKMCAPS